MCPGILNILECYFPFTVFVLFRGVGSMRALKSLKSSFFFAYRNKNVACVVAQFLTVNCWTFKHFPPQALNFLNGQHFARSWVKNSKIFFVGKWRKRDVATDIWDSTPHHLCLRIDIRSEVPHYLCLKEGIRSEAPTTCSRVAVSSLFLPVFDTYK